MSFTAVTARPGGAAVSPREWYQVLAEHRARWMAGHPVLARRVRLARTVLAWSMPVYLQGVGGDLGQQADLPPLVPAQVDHGTAVLGHQRHSGVQLGAAVAAQRPEPVAGEAFGACP